MATSTNIEVDRFEETETVRRPFEVKDANGDLASATSFTYETQLNDGSDWSDKSSDVVQNPTGYYLYSKDGLDRGLYRDRFTAVASGVSHTKEGKFRVG